MLKMECRYVATDMNTDTRSDPSYSEAAAKTIPMGFWGKPDDFKGPAIFLASEASSYVTGEILMVSGHGLGFKISIANECHCRLMEAGWGSRRELPHIQLVVVELDS
jgi:hypothetical protein